MGQWCQRFGWRCDVGLVSVSVLCSQLEAVLLHGLRLNKKKGLEISSSILLCIVPYGITPEPISTSLAFWGVLRDTLGLSALDPFVQMRYLTTDSGRGWSSSSCTHTHARTHVFLPERAGKMMLLMEILHSSEGMASCVSQRWQSRSVSATNHSQQIQTCVCLLPISASHSCTSQFELTSCWCIRWASMLL